MACRDITYDTLKFIDEHALVLQNNLHKQFCPQALCYNLHVTTSPGLHYSKSWNLSDREKICNRSNQIF